MSKEKLGKTTNFLLRKTLLLPKAKTRIGNKGVVIEQIDHKLKRSSLTPFAQNLKRDTRK